VRPHQSGEKTTLSRIGRAKLGPLMRFARVVNLTWGVVPLEKGLVAVPQNKVESERGSSSILAARPYKNTGNISSTVRFAVALVRRRTRNIDFFAIR
jgi:hypothetical protein